MLQSNDCGCLIYECTINGEGVIVWNGSAFDCIGTGNELTLFSGDQVECNNGAIQTQRNNHTFQLIITDNSLSGSNIKCIYDNGINFTVIGNLSIPDLMTHSGRCYNDSRICRIFIHNIITMQGPYHHLLICNWLMFILINLSSNGMRVVNAHLYIMT